MAHKSSIERVGNMAHHAKALYDIIKALMQGGWAAATMQTLKHYWPQIIAVSAVLTLLPLIIYCSFPMIMFGYKSSSDTDISSMNVKADEISGYYDNYEEYYSDRLEYIKKTVLNENSSDINTEITQVLSSTQDKTKTNYKVEISGEILQKYYLIAMHCVSVQNDLRNITEQSVIDFVDKCIAYKLVETPQNTEIDIEEELETGADSTQMELSGTVENNTEIVLEITYLTPDEVMDNCGFSDFDKNWVELIYKNLESEEK